jgi:hypothetical protein
MENSTESLCRICGLDFGSCPSWVEGVPQYVICECCGMESGLEDESIEKVQNYRGWWVGNGANWKYPRHKPKDWDLLKQVANIPAEWR